MASSAGAGVGSLAGTGAATAGGAGGAGCGAGGWGAAAITGATVTALGAGTLATGTLSRAVGADRSAVTAPNATAAPTPKNIRAAKLNTPHGKTRVAGCDDP